MLRILIADDEPPARRRLRKLLEPMVSAGSVEVVGEASDGVETLELARKNNVDLLLLDIQMPGYDGFDVVERLSPDRRPTVVFTTAFDNYALQAFEASAVDYLLKPISQKRLEDAIARVERVRGTGVSRMNDEQIEKLLDWIDSHAVPAKEAEPPREYLRQLSIPHRERILVVPVDRLVSAEVSEGLTRLFVLTNDDSSTSRNSLRQYIVNYTLEQLEANLDPGVFMRVHRSSIVNLDHITEMVSWFSGRYKLILVGGHDVIASRERSRLLKDRLLI
jgi:two-component system, LytTR family, response regulator